MIENYKDVQARMFHFEDWVKTTDVGYLKSTFKGLLIEANFSLVNFVEHHFPIKGFTCVWVLAESHLAIHTFPARNKSYIQISSCSEAKLEAFKNLMDAKKMQLSLSET